MSLLKDLIAQTPRFQTHQALVVLGLQNDFVSPDGKLPVPTQSGFVDRIRALVPHFRENAGDIIWVKTLFQDERAVNDAFGTADTVIARPDEQPEDGAGDSGDETTAKDILASSASLRAKSSRSKRALGLLKRVSARKQPAAPVAVPPAPEEDELFLSKTSKRAPCCLPNSVGADFVESIKPAIDARSDTIVATSHYSAFNSTTLLLTLRAKLITELYICGCITNLSVYATALDAARHGLAINIVEDCLGYRKAERHEEALRQLTELMGAYTVSSADILTDLATPLDEEKERAEDTSEVQDLLRRLSINNSSQRASKGSHASVASWIEGMSTARTQHLVQETTVKNNTDGSVANRRSTSRELLEPVENGTQPQTATQPSAGRDPREVQPSDDGEIHTAAKPRMRARKGRKKASQKAHEEETKRDLPTKNDSPLRVDATAREEPEEQPTQLDQPPEASSAEPSAGAEVAQNATGRPGSAMTSTREADGSTPHEEPAVQGR